MPRLKVVYLTSVPFATSQKNGGSICCRNHLRRIADDDAIDCTAYLIGSDGQRDASSAEAEHSCTTVRYFPINVDGLSITAPPPDASFGQRRWPFMHEYAALANREAIAQISRSLDADGPDVIIVDHLYSALFLPDAAFRRWPVVTILLNREVDFFSELVGRGMRFYDAPPSPLAAARLRRFESSVIRSSAGIVAIGKHDLPRRRRQPGKFNLVEPYLDAAEMSWQGSQSTSLFFIGNHHHYPNALAIEWIARCFAPAIWRLRPDIRLRIMGMDADEAPSNYRAPNVEFLGYGDADAARALFVESAGLLAPIANSFGAKFKLTEAAMFGTPFFASAAALSGMSYIPEAEIIDLADPDSAANQIASALTPARLAAYHLAIQDSHIAYARAQEGRWSSIAASAIARFG